MKYNKHIILLLIFGAFIVQVIGLFLPFTGDAGKYAAISKNIFESHDFLNLTIHGSNYFQKPPLLMWLSSFGYFVFGEVNNFTTRFFPFLFTFLMVFSTYRLGKLFYSKKTGRIAALFIGTSQIFFLYNTDLHTDVILTACTTFSIWQLAEYIIKRKWYNFALAFLFIGLGMLTKGPIGLAVPIFALGSHLLLTRNFKMIFNPVWLLGILIIILTILPYLFTLYQNFGWNGPVFYFWTNNAGRITGNYRENHIDPFFYIYNLFIFTLPWSVFFIGGLVNQFVNILKNKQESNIEFYTLGASVILIIILSFASMKSPNYFYPAIPLLSILAAHFFHGSIISSTKFNKFIIGFTTFQNIVIWALIILITSYLFPTTKPVTIVGLIILGLVFLYFSIQKSTLVNKILTTSLISIVAFNFVINAHLLPCLFEYQSSLKAAKIFNNEAKEDETFFTYRYAQFEMFFYAKNKGYKIKDEGHQDDPVLLKLEEALKTKNAWYLANEHSRNQIINSGANIESEFEFDHYYLTDINWKFLNPKTRESSLQKMYLIKTK